MDSQTWPPPEIKNLRQQQLRDACYQLDANKRRVAQAEMELFELRKQVLYWEQRVTELEKLPK